MARLGAWFVLMLPLAAAAAELSGQVRLSASGEALLPQEAMQAVVYFRPARRAAVEVPRREFEMRTRGKQFDPQTLVIPAGATVRFPNSDPILHNVFSAGGRNGFDLGIYARGEGRSHTFEHPGLVRVYCNVHHEMVGYIVVLDTPYVARPDAQGRYRLTVPRDAAGELFVWHARAPLWRQRLRRPEEAAADVSIALTRPLLPPHTNKFRKPYDQGAGRGY